MGRQTQGHCGSCHCADDVRTRQSSIRVGKTFLTTTLSLLLGWLSMMINRDLEPGRHGGLLRIRTSLGNFVVPIDFKVAKGGLRAHPGEVDFGTIMSPSDVK